MDNFRQKHRIQNLAPSVTTAELFAIFVCSERIIIRPSETYHHDGLTILAVSNQNRYSNNSIVQPFSSSPHSIPGRFYHTQDSQNQQSRSSIKSASKLTKMILPRNVKRGSLRPKTNSNKN